jgi:hypothetical protein
MKNLFRFTLALAIGAVSLNSCTEDDTQTQNQEPAKDNFRLSMEMTVDGLPLEIGTNAVSSNAEFNGIRVDRMMVYFADIAVQNQNDEWIPLTDALFFNLSSNNNRSFEFTLPEGDYKALRFGLGLNAAQNGSDPLTHELDDPLSTSNGMYWSWATKYRFVIMEGRFNLNGAIQGSTDDLPYAYHPGHDDFYEVQAYSKVFEITNGSVSEARISVPLEQVIDGAGGLIDLPIESSTHTTPEDYYIAEKYMDNFRNAIFLK